jgi:hypothetical protein
MVHSHRSGDERYDRRALPHIAKGMLPMCPEETERRMEAPPSVSDEGSTDIEPCELHPAGLLECEDSRFS